MSTSQSAHLAESACLGHLVKEGPLHKLEDFSSTFCPESCSGCEYESQCSMAQEEIPDDSPSVSSEVEGLKAQIAEARKALEYAYDNRDTRHEYDKQEDTLCCGIYRGQPCDCHVSAIEKTLKQALEKLK